MRRCAFKRMGGDQVRWKHVVHSPQQISGSKMPAMNAMDIRDIFILTYKVSSAT